MTPPAEPSDQRPTDPTDPDRRAGGASADEVTAAVRAVLRRALRDMLLLVAALTVVGLVVGWSVAGAPGVWGALIGAAIVLVFSGTTVLSMLRTAGSSVTTTGAVVLGAWLVKVAVLVGVFAVLDGLDFYHRGVLVAVVLAGVVGSALLDYRAVVGGRVPYVAPQD